MVLQLTSAATNTRLTYDHNKTGMLQVREVREKSGEKKQDWKSGKSQGIRSQVREKSGNFDVGKNEKFGRKSGKSQGISLLDSCSNPARPHDTLKTNKYYSAQEK
ncbi:hypothetical protein J6590_106190 [Homalodisca vitripennis]|nr:hypothetical protein J6590_106190 [Homalodisca vitripennis]